MGTLLPFIADRLCRLLDCLVAGLDFRGVLPEIPAVGYVAQDVVGLLVFRDPGLLEDFAFESQTPFRHRGFCC